MLLILRTKTKLSHPFKLKLKNSTSLKGIRFIVSVIRIFHLFFVFRSLEIINTDNKNAYTALEANLKKVEGERDLANQSFSKIKEERSQLSSELKVNSLFLPISPGDNLHFRN